MSFCAHWKASPPCLGCYCYHSQSGDLRQCLLRFSTHGLFRSLHLYFQVSKHLEFPDNLYYWFIILRLENLCCIISILWKLLRLMIQHMIVWVIFQVLLKTLLVLILARKGKQKGIFQWLRCGSDASFCVHSDLAIVLRKGRLGVPFHVWLTARL